MSASVIYVTVLTVKYSVRCIFSPFVGNCWDLIVYWNIQYTGIFWILFSSYLTQTSASKNQAQMHNKVGSPAKRFTSMCTLQQHTTMLICIRRKNTELHNGAVVQPSVICSAVQKVLNSTFGKQTTINTVIFVHARPQFQVLGLSFPVTVQINVHLDDCSDPDQKTIVYGGFSDSHKQVCAAPPGCVAAHKSLGCRITSAAALQQRSQEASPTWYQQLFYFCSLAFI